MANAEILAESVSKYYGAHPRVCAIRNLNVAVSSGQRVAVVGKSGSGKSTLLNLVAGLDHPSEGKLVIGGRGLHEMSSDEMSRYRLETVGVIFQAFQLIPQRTAIQNVELPLILEGLDRRRRKQRASMWLERVGLSHRLNHHPYQMSGGEQQRVAIARALVNEPKLVLADEPTGNLDSATADEVVRLLAELCDDTGATFMLVTHDNDLANRICARKLCMRDGVLTEQFDDAHA